MADAPGPEGKARESIARAPWVMFPEFVLYWLSGRRVAEYTNASHTGLVNLKTGDWDAELFEMLGLADRGCAADCCDGDGAGADDRDRWRSSTHFARRRSLRRQRTIRRARLRAFRPI